MSRRDHFSGVNMKKTTLSARFLAGFEPMVLPPRGPEGMIPAGAPKKLPVIDPPSLCEAGPCNKFHRIRSIMDAEDGGNPGALRTEVTRGCYPSPGIEIELGETPILQCSLWEPGGEQSRMESVRHNFLKSADGKAFTEKMLAFEEANDAAREIEAVPAPLPSTPSTPAVAAPVAPAPEEKIDLPPSSFDVSDAELDALEDEVMP